MADSPVLKALAILKCVASRGVPTGVQELSSSVGMNTSTVHRLLRLMVEDGTVAYDPERRTYAIGTEGVRLATHVLGSTSLIGRIRPHVAQLAADLGETCAFTLYEPKSASKIVAIVERGRHALGYEFDVGSRDGVHAGASGKPILAFLPEAEIDNVLRSKLPKLTQFTVIDPEELRKQIVQIRKTGYAISHGERIPGAGVGIGAPVFAPSQRVVGAVVVTIPQFRWRKSRLSQIAKQVITTANKVSSIFDPSLLPSVAHD